MDPLFFVPPLTCAGPSKTMSEEGGVRFGLAARPTVTVYARWSADGDLVPRGIACSSGYNSPPPRLGDCSARASSDLISASLTSSMATSSTT